MNASNEAAPERSLKVPDITPHFWAIKLLTTAMGEALSDYLVITINPVIAVGIGALGLAIALWLQFKSRAYVPSIYWFTVAMVAVFGTMAADVLHVGLGVPYLAATILFAVCLAIVFVIWKRIKGTLSIHSIRSPRRETFYWLTVMATFALGTAAGDLTATTFGLGYLGSIGLFAIIMLIPLGLRMKFKANEVFTFWFAYILTRPLGASIADWFGDPKWAHGLGIGHGPVAIVLIIAIVIYVRWLTVQRRRVNA